MRACICVCVFVCACVYTGQRTDVCEGCVPWGKCSPLEARSIRMKTIRFIRGEPKGVQLRGLGGSVGDMGVQLGVSEFQLGSREFSWGLEGSVGGFGGSIGVSGVQLGVSGVQLGEVRILPHPNIFTLCT